MYLFARTRTAAPDRLADATAYAVDVAARVSSITGLEVAAHQVEYGAPLTDFSWTTTVESLAEMGAAREKIAADAGYLASVEEAHPLFAGPAEDAIVEIVATAGTGGHRGGFASTISAQCAPGKIGEAMAWGVEILNHVAGITGRDGLFGRSMYGPWAGVGWINLADSLDEVEAAASAMNADAEYVAKVDGGGHLFLAGSGASVLTRRLD